MKTLKWEIKTAERDYWYIKAVRRGVTESSTEPDYYETAWDVTVTTSPCSPDYKVKFTLSTQYDEPIGLDDIVREMHSNIMALYGAAMVQVGIAHARMAANPDLAREQP